MAQLQVESDPFLPGRWTLRSDHPGALAAIPDAIVQVLGLDADVLSAWAVHYDEQNEYAENAYANERRELGHGPVAEVISLPRSPQPHVVRTCGLVILNPACSSFSSYSTTDPTR